MIPHDVDPYYHDPLPGWGFVPRVVLMVLTVFLVVGALVLGSRTEIEAHPHRGGRIEYGAVLQDQDGPRTMSQRVGPEQPPPATQFMQFDSADEANDWLTANPYVHIIRWEANLAVAKSDTTGFEHSKDLVVYRITIQFQE